jgi:hypothetical protein
MRKIFKLHTFVLFCALAWVTSCQKADIETFSTSTEVTYDRSEYEKNLVDRSITDAYVVRSGILHFSDYKAFSEIQEKFRTLNETEKQKLFADQGFSSYSNEFAMASEKISNAASKEEYNRMLSNNKDIVEIEADGSLRPKAGSSFVNDFTNRQGLLYIGKVLYQFG